MVKRYHRQGFTLIEIILAIALFAILAIAFVPAFVSAFRWITNAGKLSKGIYTSQDVLENTISLWEKNGATVSTDSIDLDFEGTTVKVYIDSYTDGEMEMFLRTPKPTPIPTIP